MRKLKTSLKPTVKTTDVLDVKMENLLSKNPVVTVLYTRNDNRYLVCKSASTFKLGFPVIKPIIVNFAVQTGKSTSKDIANQVIDTMRKEFGLDPEILNYYEGTRRPYLYQGSYLRGNDIAFDTRDAGQYVGKPEIVKNPSGEYTDERWLTLSEINDLMNQGLFDENSSYYAIRCSEAKRKRAVLDPRLSLHVYADKDGVHFNNNSKDQIPLKTLNGNGLQKLEETEDYCIYICKDAIMTTVEKYAPGAYQKFQETQALINSNEGLLKEYSIDWVNKDDADLFIQINNDEVAKIESQPMMLPVEGEEQVQPMVLEPKTVPTTYDCCFTVRKDDNYSLYINEGYENLVKTGYSWGTNSIKKSNGYLESTRLDEASGGYIVSLLHASIYNARDIFSVSYENINGLEYVDRFEVNSKGFGILISKNKIKDSFTTPALVDSTTTDNIILAFYNKEETKLKTFTSKVIITKTSTPKPFIKSIQPNCKLSFVADITSNTHSFLVKGITTAKRETMPIMLPPNEYYEIHKTVEDNFNKDLSLVFTKNVVYAEQNGSSLRVVKFNNVVTKNEIKLAPVYIFERYQAESFSQLLIYKGNLTEAELKTELEKLDDQGFSYKKTKNTTKGERYGNLESVRNNIR